LGWQQQAIMKGRDAAYNETIKYMNSEQHSNWAKHDNCRTVTQDVRNLKKWRKLVSQNLH